MTKLEALNKIVTEKLAGTKEGKTILEAVNLATKAYGGAGSASNLGDAIEQLYSVFTKGGGGGGDEHLTLDFSQKLDFKGETDHQIVTLISFATGSVSYAGIDLSESDFFPALIEATKVTSVDYSGIKNTSGVKVFTGMLMGTAIESVDLSPIDFSSVHFLEQAFSHCPNLKTLNLSMITKSTVTGEYWGYMASHCPKLERVNLSNVDFNGLTDFSNLFEGDTSLTHIDFKASSGWGTNVYGSIDFSYSPLDRETIVQFFNNLGTVTGKSIVLNPTTMGYLSEEDKAIATNKGWTLT